MANSEYLQKIYKIAKDNESLPQYIIDGVDYFTEIRNCNKLSDALVYKDKIDIKNIILIYLSNNKELSDDEKEIVKIYVTNAELIEQESIIDQVEKFKTELERYEDMIDEMEKLYSLDYNIVEEVNRKHFIMKNIKGKNKTLNDMVVDFNSLTPTKNVQVIILTNSESKKIYKVSNIYPIQDITNIIDLKTTKNTITLIYEKNKTAILNFETSECEIEINNRKNDVTEFYISEILGDLITLELKRNVNTLEGKIELRSVTPLPYFEFYEFIMVNSIASNFFIVDERKNPWCVTKKFFKIQFVDPLCFLLDKYLNTIYSYGEIKISSSPDTKYCSVTFETKDSILSQKMFNYFAKIVGLFYGQGPKKVDINYENFFFSSTLKEIKYRAEQTIKSYGEKSSSEGYSSKCQSDYQPIFISSEEIEDYLSIGKEVSDITIGETTWHFTCMKENFPYTRMMKTSLTLSSGKDEIPCCAASRQDNKSNSKKKIAQNKKISTSKIKEFGKVLESFPDTVFSDFIKASFDESSNSINVQLMGTSIKENEKLKSNNSLIIALILATTSNQKKSQQELLHEIADVRRKMISLPYEVYAQELYDISKQEFVDNILDEDHYIDPYYYYRGLEEIFNVNILCFIMEKKQFPSSYEDLKNENCTIEIPRCTQYHTRRFDPNRNIVMVFKNFGSERARITIPSCELICISTNGNLLTSINNSNTKFMENIYNLYNENCNPFFINEKVEIFSNIQDFDPNELGFGTVVGQELDIYGKTKLLIYDEWNVEFSPSIQPLNLKGEPEEGTFFKRNGKIDREKIINNEVNYQRAELKTLEECLEIFKENVYSVVDDGIFIRFQGNDKSIKVLCKHDYKAVNYEVIEEIIKDQNDVSALLQLLNWLWRSEYTEDEGLIDFKSWIETKIELFDYLDIEIPNIPLNNLYLRNYNNYEKRIKFLEQIWPSFFRDGKICMEMGLYNRVLNLMNFQDMHTRFITPEENYGQKPRFITGLIPTKEDYDNYESMIFTKDEHLKHWFNYSNRMNVSHISVENMNVANNRIYEELSLKINPYFYISDYGKIFLVQNIHSKIESKNCAIEVAKQWDERRENIGPYVNYSSQNVQSLKYVIFKMNNEGIPVPSINKSSGSENYLCILMYTNKIYAAMLPIN